MSYFYVDTDYRSVFKDILQQYSDVDKTTIWSMQVKTKKKIYHDFLCKEEYTYIFEKPNLYGKWNDTTTLFQLIIIVYYVYGYNTHLLIHICERYYIIHMDIESFLCISATKRVNSTQ